MPVTIEKTKRFRKLSINLSHNFFSFLNLNFIYFEYTFLKFSYRSLCLTKLEKTKTDQVALKTYTCLTTTKKFSFACGIISKECD